jgi:DegV family protein with EDD domain
MSDQRIAVVTDSTAYIPKEALGEFDIPAIPLWLIWGDDRFRDGVDIDPPTFYGRLPGSKVFPTTSQPSAGEFVEFFQQAGQGAGSVVAVLISSKLSGTVASALAAKADLPGMDIHIVDSLSTSMELGFGVLQAARAAASGKPVGEVVAAAEAVRATGSIMFVVDTLEFLHRGGRIGGAKRLLGTALNLKPLLSVEDGRIEALASVRTKRKAVAKMLDIAEERLGGKEMAEAAVLDVNCPEEGRSVADMVKERFGLPVVYRTKVSPVIGAHVGPGTVGVCFYPKA